MPKCFTDYINRQDSLSGVLSKYLKENKLLPTDQHTIYSLRHNFQDRLLAVNAPDRLQANLMGHKFSGKHTEMGRSSSKARVVAKNPVKSLADSQFTSAL
jgi:hypothetical protein